MLEILAIVGSQQWPDGSEQRVKQLIHDQLLQGMPDLVISGGASGVDMWAIEVAAELGIATDWRSFLPENHRWQPRGYKARNIKIARACSRLLCIRSRTSSTYGSGWTADYAERLGKPVTREVL